MALKKDFATGTKYYYHRIASFSWEHEGLIRIAVDCRVRDTADANIDYVESSKPFAIGSGYLPDANDRWNATNLDLVNINAIQQCYEFLKSDIEEYATGWTDV